MVVLRVVERWRVDDLGGDGAVAGGGQGVLVGLLRRQGQVALPIVVDVESGAVLRTEVVALAHALGWIVTLPEHLEQVRVADDLGVEDG